MSQCPSLIDSFRTLSEFTHRSASLWPSTCLRKDDRSHRRPLGLSGCGPPRLVTTLFRWRVAAYDLLQRRLLAPWGPWPHAPLIPRPFRFGRARALSSPVRRGLASGVAAAANPPMLPQSASWLQIPANSCARKRQFEGVNPRGRQSRTTKLRVRTRVGTRSSDTS